MFLANLDDNEFLHLVSEDQVSAGTVPILHEMYLGVVDFNMDKKEAPIGKDNINVLDFK